MEEIIRFFLTSGAKAKDEAHWVVGVLAEDTEALTLFRDAIRAAINQKAAGNPNKARKLFYAMSDTARNIFGDTYEQVRKDFDRASRAASK